MKTEDLIQRLGHESRPVRPLPSPGYRAMVWLAGAAAYVVLVASVSWLRHGTLFGITDDGPYVMQQLALVATAVLAARAAFDSVIPGLPVRGRWSAGASIALVMIALVWEMTRDVGVRGGVGPWETDWPCVVSISVGGVLLWSVATAMLRRGVTLSPMMSSVFAGLAAIGVVNVEACVTRPHVYALTVLLWHGTTSMIVVVLLAAIGRHALRWSPTAMR